MLEPTTAAELKEIDQLRDLLQDLQIRPDKFGDGEYLYVRWLRAKKHNISEAAEAIRKHVKHRETFELDTIESWEPCEDAKPYLQYEFIGYDDESCPVSYIPWGSWDMKKLIELGCGRDEIKRLCQIMELSERKMEETTRELGKRVPGSVFLMDLDKFSLKSVISKAALDIIIETAIIMDTYYTASCKVCPVLNAPKAFFYLWKILKPFLSADLRNKIVFQSRDSDLKEFFVSKKIPDTCVPTVFGGEYELKLVL